MYCRVGTGAGKLILYLDLGNARVREPVVAVKVDPYLYHLSIRHGGTLREFVTDRKGWYGVNIVPEPC